LAVATSICRSLASTLALWLCASTATASTLDVSLSSPEAAPGESVTYSIVVHGGGIDRYDVPRFGELRASGPSTSQSNAISMVNGQVSVQREVSVRWRISAARAGRYVIPAPTVVSEGETLTGPELTLVVTGSARQNAPSAQPPSTGFFDDLIDARPPPPPQAPTEEDVILRAEVDTTSPRVGQQVVLSLYLYARIGVTRVDNIAFPKLDGFWAEDIDSPDRLTGQPRRLGGEEYLAYLIRRRVLFPLHAGAFTIDPVEASIRPDTLGVWGGSSKPLRRRSRPVRINVRALPEEGVPEEFTAGNVGQWNLVTRTDSTVTQVGRPIKLTLQLKGDGNLKGPRLPVPRVPDGLRALGPTLSEKGRFDGGRYGGSRTAEWLLIPERPGRFTLEGMRFAYFDPERDRYEVATTPQLELEAVAGSSTSGDDATGRVTSTIEGPRPPRFDTPPRQTPSLPWRTVPFWLVVIAPLAWVVVAVARWLRAALLRREDSDARRRRRARAEAERRLAQAAQLAARGERGEALAEIARALLDLVATRLQIPALGLSTDQLPARLLEAGVPQAEAEAAGQLLARCESARFSPLPPDAQEVTALREQAIQLIVAVNDAASRRSAA